MLSPYTSIVLSLCLVTVMSGMVLPHSLSEVKSSFWYSFVLLSLGQPLVFGCVRWLLG